MLYVAGKGHHNDNTELLLNDQLAAMGDGLSQEQGSLAWIEAFTIARALASALNFIQLLSNQFTPNNISIYADRWADIYGLGVLGNGFLPTNLAAIQQYMALKEAVFGTPPNLSATIQYITAILGPIFIDIEWSPEIQNLATHAPLTATEQWFSPLSVMFVRIWQPRDNQDNLLMPNNVFLGTADNYKVFVEQWQPAYIGVRNMHLLYPGNDGYGSYASGLNVINGTAGGTTITGIDTLFTQDLSDVTALGYEMPIEVVDDTNTLQTYFVKTVNSDTSITITSPIINNITGRTYRLLGIEMDVLFALDNLLFNE